VGEPPDMPEAIRLMELSEEWKHTTSPQRREAVWREMLNIHAEQLFGIGILSGAPQPVVVNKRLRNIPAVGNWAWDPGAHFGMYRIDEFYFSDADEQQLTQ
jgi:peptide/nickel transport system substrate-binding protein